MSITRVIALALALALAHAVLGEDFDASNYYGNAFRPDPDDARSGVLRDTLTGEQPSWIEFSGSGDDLAGDRFKLTDSGLSVHPNKEHGTCEAVIDLGIRLGTLQVTIDEIAQGSAVAWHLRDLVGDAAWLVELKHKDKGGFELRVRVRNRNRYTVAPGSVREINALQLPVNFTAFVGKGKLTGEVGKHKTEQSIDEHSGVGAGLAVTDETARFSNLVLTVNMHDNWVVEAHERLMARKALGRLREFATVGLLSGVAEYRHPDTEAALRALDETAADARRKAMASDIYDRASILVKLANAYPKLSAVQHEAGVAALIAGDVAAAQTLLKNADKLKRANITSLALAEANRRANDISAAERALLDAKAGLPDGLRPDCALIEGRLRADRGDIAGAEKILRAAGQTYPEHQQLQAFADSAAVLYDPGMLEPSAVVGPLGLTLLTDLSPAQFVPVLEQLKPYVEKFRLWLPDLDEKLTGRIAIFGGPVAYLRAALLVAGDNLDNVAGMYLSHGIRGDPTVMACRAFGEDELLRTLVHELWHLALASTGSERVVPRWLNEGMAVFLSAGQVVNGVMRYDALPSEFRGYMESPPSVEQIEQALTSDAADFYVPGLLRENYAAAWAVVLFYASESGALQQLREMLKGKPSALGAVNPRQLQPAVSKRVESILGD